MPPRHASTHSTTAKWPIRKGARHSLRDTWKTTPRCCPCTSAQTRRPPNWARETTRRPSPRARRPSSCTASRSARPPMPTSARRQRRKPTWLARSSTHTSTAHGSSWPRHSSAVANSSKRPAPTTISCGSTARSPTSHAWPRRDWHAATWLSAGPTTPRTYWERCGATASHAMEPSRKRTPRQPTRYSPGSTRRPYHVCAVPSSTPRGRLNGHDSTSCWDNSTARQATTQWPTRH